LDLAVVASVLSSNEDIAISEHYCFAGEIGLSGEIRPIAQAEQRITEAEKLGYEKILFPILINSEEKIRD
jgi:DNA repair protein RadA/Sms